MSVEHRFVLGLNFVKSDPEMPQRLASDAQLSPETTWMSRQKARLWREGVLVPSEPFVDAATDETSMLTSTFTGAEDSSLPGLTHSLFVQAFTVPWTPAKCSKAPTTTPMVCAAPAPASQSCSIRSPPAARPPKVLSRLMALSG
jgi:hypothetical protein